MKFPLESQEAIGEKMMRMVPAGMQSSRSWEIKSHLKSMKEIREIETIQAAVCG